jgi:hypothetical protein
MFWLVVTEMLKEGEEEEEEEEELPALQLCVEATIRFEAMVPWMTEAAVVTRGLGLTARESTQDWKEWDT